MPIPLFPDIPFSYTLQLSSEFRTLITPFETGKEQRRAKWLYPRRRLILNFRARTPSEIDQIKNFFVQRRGAFEPFHIYYPLMREWKNEYIGIGDGATTTFDLKVKNSSTVNIYLDGVLQTTGYSISSGTGENGSDQVVFTTAPGSGVVITADYTGYKRFLVRMEDRIGDEVIEGDNINALSIPLVEVKE